MTLHQLTHATTFEIDLGVVTALRRLLAPAVKRAQSWAVRSRSELEMASLDHRERSDLAFRT